MKVQFRLNSKEVEILRRGEEIVLREKRGTGAQRADDREQRSVDCGACQGSGVDAGYE
jgi:virulence-associated protein VagC